MIKRYFLLILSLPILGMTPKALIKSNIKDPDICKNSLQEKFSNLELTGFHDLKYNNLIHITIKELIKNKNDEYEKLLERSKPLLRYLYGLGVKVNELNDKGHAPHFLIYYDQDNRTELFERFLENELKAHPTYFSLQPQMRKFRRYLYTIICCDCKNNKKSKNK
jgi:hypothetical protein